MRTLDQWLDEYNASHQKPRNNRIHYWCLPVIALCTVALLWLVPIPYTNANLGQLLLILAMAFYGYLSTRLALAMLPMVVLLAAGIMFYQATISLPLWIPASIAWVVAWIFKFIGHKEEAQKPSFFTDILFLLIGPLWILAAGFKKLGLSYR